MPARGLVRAALVASVVRLLEGLGLVVVFVSAGLAATLLHANMAPARAVAARITSAVLSDLVRGTITIETYTRLGLREIEFPGAVVRDPHGGKVLTVYDVRVVVDVVRLIRDVAFAEEKLDVAIESVRFERADVELIADSTTGRPTIAGAFEPVPSRAPRAPTAEKPRYVRVWFPSVEIGKAWARSSLPDLPTSETTLSAVKGSVLVTPKGTAVDVDRFGAVLRGVGGADFAGTGRVHVRAPGRVWGWLDGFFGELEVGAFAANKGDHLEVRLDFPNATPEAVSAVLPSWPLLAPASGTVHATGTLPRLDTKARFAVGTALVDATGTLTVSGDVGADLEITGTGVDAKVLFAEAPRTFLRVDGAVEVWLKKGSVNVDVNGRIAPTLVAGHSVPPIDVLGRLEDGGFKGRINVHEPGMPVRANLEIHPSGAVDIEADARSFAIHGAPRLAGMARGRADVKVAARVEKKRFGAKVSAHVAGLEVGDLRLASGSLTANAEGPLGDLTKTRFDARLAGQALGAGRFGFEAVSATARGGVTSQRVSADLRDRYGPSVKVSGVVTPGARTRIREMEVAVARAGAELRGRIARLDVGAGTLDATDLTLTGAGGPLTGSVSVRPDEIAADLHGKNVDLDALATALGIGRGTIGGRLNLETRARVGRDTMQGSLRAALTAGSVLGFPGVTFDIDSSVAGTAFTGTASARMEHIGSVSATWDARAPSHPLDPGAWRALLGTGIVKLRDLDLSNLEHVLPKSLGVVQVRGKVEGEFRVERPEPAPLPSIMFNAKTIGLDALVDVDGVRHHVKDMDVLAGGVFDGRTGKSDGTTQVVHGGTALAVMTGTLQPDLAAILRDPDDLVNAILDAPLEAAFTVGRRRFRDLPELIRPQGVVGTIESLRVEVSGKPGRPTLASMIVLDGVTQEDRPDAVPLRIQARPHLVPHTGEFGSHVALFHEGRPVANGTITGRVRLPRGAEPVDWVAAGDISLDGLPVGVVPDLADADIAGSVFGRLLFTRSNTEAQLSVPQVEIRDLTVGRTRIGTARIAVEPEGGEQVAKVRLLQPRGSLEGEARAGLVWSGVTPGLDTKKPVRVSAEARNLDAVVLKPLFGDALSELGGDLTAKLDFALHASEDTAGALKWRGDISGRAKLERGVVQVAAMGLELRDASFTAKVEQARGLTLVTTDDIQARARSKNVNLTARARLVFDGLELTGGSASAQLEDVPILVEGVNLGNARATLAAEFLRQRQPDLFAATIRVQQGSVRLPRSSSRNVISLRDNPDVTIVQRQKPPTGDSVLPWQVTFEVGRVVIRRADLELPIRGAPVVMIAEDTAVGGEIELIPGGRLPALGKIFIVESGVVRFDTGDPANPHVQATARWRAPDGTLVYVDFTGTLAEARLTLRSDPAKSEAELYALIVGGSSTGSSDGESGNPGAVAAGVGSAAVLGEVFAETPVELRADSTREGRQAVTGGYRQDNVTAEVTYAPPGGGTIGEEEDHFILTTDLRMSERWSLRYQVGTRTFRQQIDLIWQYRY